MLLGAKIELQICGLLTARSLSHAKTCPNFEALRSIRVTYLQHPDLIDNVPHPLKRVF